MICFYGSRAAGGYINASDLKRETASCHEDVFQVNEVHRKFAQFELVPHCKLLSHDRSLKF
ncbi:MAG: hypothetical protein DMG76_33425 [Acidobacteria bacterium]|nr:MAG: hypothetical protein DMG76_33425 [Acidobacteriota bacterium]